MTLTTRRSSIPSALRAPNSGFRIHECSTRDRECRARCHEHRQKHRTDPSNAALDTSNHQPSPQSSGRFVIMNAASATTNPALLCTTQLPSSPSTGGSPSVVEFVTICNSHGIKFLQTIPPGGGYLLRIDMRDGQPGNGSRQLQTLPRFPLHAKLSSGNPL